MMIVGLTGGIGSGKSTVAAFFKALGVPVYDSDAEAKYLMVDSEEVKGKVIALFGEKAYLDEKLNKTHISSIVFENEEKLKQLNQIVHPAVRKHFKSWVSKQHSPYVIQETALIFENDMQSYYDAIILVTSPEKTRIQRVMKRDAVSKSQVKARISNQLLDQHKKGLADFVIENDHLDETEITVNQIHSTLLDMASL